MGTGLPDGATPGGEGSNISTPLILNTGDPQGCVLSPLLYSLFTHDCVAMHASNAIIKFADDTTVVGLITNNEPAYREEVRALGAWCQENNLPLNVNKTPLQHQQRLFTLRRLKNLACHQKHSQTFTEEQSRVSPPGTATAPPTTVRLSRG